MSFNKIPSSIIAYNSFFSPLRSIKRCSRSSIFTNKEQLQYNLFQSGIGVVYRENAVGRLYGITFINHNTGVVLNGSRLGKEYAANAIVDRLENPHKYEHLAKDPLNLLHSNSPFVRKRHNLFIAQNNTSKAATLVALSVRYSDIAQWRRPRGRNVPPKNATQEEEGEADVKP